MLQAVFGSHSLCGVDNEALVDKIACSVAYCGPVFFWCIAVVGRADGLNLFDLAARYLKGKQSEKLKLVQMAAESIIPIAIKRCIASAQEVCNHTECPDIDGFAVSCLAEDPAVDRTISSIQVQ